MTQRYALMWSGGKDSALALDRARRSGLDVDRLISFYDSATRRVRFHRTPVEMPLAPRGASLDRELGLHHDEEFVGLIFGDIHLADVRHWYETRVVAAGLQHVEPIWGEPPPALLAEFVSSGGRAVLTCVELAKLDESWLGRVTDDEFAADIKKVGVDACGENGEYHSFAFSGPVFNRPVRWIAGERRLDAGFAQLDLVGAGGSLTLGLVR